MNNNAGLWIDMINPSDVHFFKPFINDLTEYNICSTTRDRAETVELANYYNITNKIIGTDYQDSFRKSVYMIYRTIDLTFNVPTFKASLSFENGMCVLASRFHKRPSISFCDNDLKFFQKKSSIQDLETKIKTLANYTIVPEACYDNFKNHFDENKLLSFDGNKEDVYIADYEPDKNFLNGLPFDNFIVIRPEAFGSIYIKEVKSIVPELLASFIRDGKNIIYLPRDNGDANYVNGTNVFIPDKPLNGLDLCYYADAILTGSGTLAREASVMGTPSVSFFPSDIMLSVDQKMINEERMLHSREIEEITDYINSHKKQKLNLDRCKKVKKYVIDITRDILERYFGEIK